MMKLFYGWFVLGMLYRGALGAPRPDFGIDGTVSGSGKVQSAASAAGAEFDLIDLKTISLETHYTRLHNLEDELTAIGTQIATAGQDLAATLEALALATDTLPGVFDDATDAIDSVRTLLMTGLSAQTDAIEEMVGSYIGAMLTDASDELLDTLTRLETELGLMQAGINSAVSAYDSPTIPANFIRRYVSPKVVFELLRALHDLHSQLPLVTYIIELTLGHLESADIYLSSVMEHATSTVYEVIMHYDGFKREIVESTLLMADAVATPFRLAYDAQTEELDFVMADLEEMGSYSTALEPVLGLYEAALGDVNRDLLAVDIETIFSDYLAQVVALDDYIDRFYDEKLCAPVQAVLQVLIASGPWADFCFSKYSPRMYELVSINSNRFLMCYEIEADRLQRLTELVDRLTVQIIFDVEDLASHVLECFYRIERASDCIAMIGPYYNELGALLGEKQDDLINLLEFETSASYNRMAACVAGGKCGLISSAEDIVDNIQACEIDGPNAGAN